MVKDFFIFYLAEKPIFRNFLFVIIFNFCDGRMTSAFTLLTVWKTHCVFPPCALHPFIHFVFSVSMRIGLTALKNASKERRATVSGGQRKVRRVEEGYISVASTQIDCRVSCCDNPQNRTEIDDHSQDLSSTSSGIPYRHSLFIRKTK